MGKKQIESRKVCVLRDDRLAAECRWRSRGWTVMRVTKGDTIPGKGGCDTVILHIQRPK